ncbi:CPCC family cysteine-rich protein [Anaerotignum sp. MB30-C6]|uniref:CPCC family cysteine-rich protein n=1 Tax=Anaerotignum sp. MB30-C6 TaxID=3070814 RepID=UPI0027DD0AA2|nr:CPCC family cysteine-rich protein [Anaerotignum sp. MB30-C6]WMI81355.1 CPCC family cysteine-rich protein [Anaerotignum sp. MB30-C6]
MAYICPVRFWEIDLFAKADDEPSDQNYGLTLCEARNNYGEFGAALPRLKEYCTEAKDWELPRK